MRVFGSGIDDAIERTAPLFRAGGLTLEVRDPPWSGDDVVALLIDPDRPVAERDLVRLPSLRVIATASVGVDHIDLGERPSVAVVNVPGYCDEEVAETALAFALALMRGIVTVDRDVRDGVWINEPELDLRTARSSQIGLIGCGSIARALASRAGAIGFDVVGHDPFLGDAVLRGSGITPVSEAEALDSDVVSLHVPLTPETEGLVDRAWLARLRPGALLINTARGGLVDIDALCGALGSGHLGGAALDVLPIEPPTQPVPRHPRLIITSHIAWFSRRAREEAYRRAAMAIVAALTPGGVRMNAERHSTTRRCAQ